MIGGPSCVASRPEGRAGVWSACAGAVALAVAVGCCASAHAQTVTSVDQVPQRTSRSAAAAAPPQVRRADGADRTSVAQLPGSLSEKPGARAAGVQGADRAPSVPSQSQMSAPVARRAGSVDADEIARLLDRGEAASIDAAAAIASGVAQQAPAPEADDPSRTGDDAQFATPGSWPK